MRERKRGREGQNSVLTGSRHLPISAHSTSIIVRARFFDLSSSVPPRFFWKKARFFPAGQRFSPGNRRKRGPGSRSNMHFNRSRRWPFESVIQGLCGRTRTGLTEVFRPAWNGTGQSKWPPSYDHMENFSPYQPRRQAYCPAWTLTGCVPRLRRA